MEREKLNLPEMIVWDIDQGLQHAIEDPQDHILRIEHEVHDLLSEQIKYGEITTGEAEQIYFEWHERYGSKHQHSV